MAEYIEREAAFNAVLKLVPKVDDDGYCWVIRGDAATAIDSIPAADVRPVVRGKWTRHRVGNTPWGSDCSVCGEWLVIDRLVMQEKYHFCPNCGADMREES